MLLPLLLTLIVLKPHESKPLFEHYEGPLQGEPPSTTKPPTTTDKQPQPLAEHDLEEGVGQINLRSMFKSDQTEGDEGDDDTRPVYVSRYYNNEDPHWNHGKGQGQPHRRRPHRVGLDEDISPILVLLIVMPFIVLLCCGGFIMCGIVYLVSARRQEGQVIVPQIPRQAPASFGDGDTGTRSSRYRATHPHPNSRSSTPPGDSMAVVRSQYNYNRTANRRKSIPPPVAPFANYFPC